MMRNRLVLAGALVLSAALLAHPAASAEPKEKKKHQPPPAPAQGPVGNPGAAQTLGTEGAWSAYEFTDKTGRVCYLVARPERTAPANAKRRPPSAMVTHRPEESVANVVSFAEGYTLKEGSDVRLDAGGSKFDLFVKDDSAWARTSELDKAIVATFMKARDVTVRGTPQHGPATLDTYSLKGFKKALELIDKACGIKR